MDNHSQSHEIPEDTASQEEPWPEALRSVAQWYAAQPRPHPSPAANQRLLARVMEEEVTVIRASFQARSSLVQTVRMTRWQLHLLGPWFWITSVLLLLLGVVVAPALPRAAAIPMLIYVLPLTAILSMVYALRRVAPGLRDIEVSSPTGFVEMMAGLVLALVCFNGLLGVLATGAMALAQWASFSTVLTDWLGPLLLLVAISFPVALRWGTLPAMLIGGGPWLILIVLAAGLPELLPAHFLTGTQTGFSLAFHLLAAGLGAAALLLLFLRGLTWQRLLVHP
jgi:hypothetical protein